MKSYIQITSIIIVIASLNVTAQAASLSFQQGDGGLYSDTQATHIRGDLPNTNFGFENGLRVDELDEGRTLIRFGDIFGEAVDQISATNLITSATLRLHVEENPSLDTFTIHQVLVSWSEAAVTWNNFGSGAGGSSGQDYVATATDTLIGAPVGFNAFDVTSNLQAWQTSGDNFGWLIKSDGTDGVLFRSDEFLQLGVRPLLEVEIAAVPLPSAALLFISAIGFIGRGIYKTKSTTNL